MANAGELIAYLRLDRSDYDNELRVAGAKADELAAKSPNIRVKVDSATALAQLASIAAASKVAQDAQGRERVAEASLTAAREKATAAAKALSDAEAKGGVAESKLETLRRQAARSTVEVARGEENVMKARRDQAAATISLASAYAKADADAKKLGDTESSLSKFSRDAKNSTSGLITTLLAVAPAIVPIAVVAAGAAGALGLLGAAGILAVLGISNEMKNGTPLGQQYAQTISVLKGNLTSLERSAASGFLGPFNAAVQRSQALMPGLNAQMQTYGGLVGNIAGHLLGGFIGGLHTLEPLFRTIAVALDRGAASFDHWAQSSTGLGKFGATVQQYLPQVVSTLGAVSQAIVRILASLGPLGGSSLTILKAFADVINSMPVPVITALAYAFIAMRTAALGLNILSTVAKNIDSFATAAQKLGSGGSGVAGGLGLMGGAAIIASGALFGLTQIMGQNAAKQREQAQAVAAYTQAIKDANGATGQAIDASVLQQAQANGNIDAMKRIGVSTVAWTQAVEQGGGAYTTLLAQLAKSGPLGVTLSSNLYEQRNAYKAAVQQAKDYADATSENNKALAAANPALTNQAATLGLTVTALQYATDAANKKRQADQAARAELVLDHPEYQAMSSALGLSADAYLNAKDAADKTAASTANARAQLVLAHPEYREASRAIGVTADSYLAAKEAADQQAKSTEQSRVTMILTSDAAGLLKTAMDALNGVDLSVAQASTSYDASLLSLTKSLHDNGKTVAENTDKGVANRQSIEQSISAAQAQAQAVANATKSTVRGTAAYNANGQAILARIAKQNGDKNATDRSRDAVYQYAQQLLGLGKIKVSPTKIDADTRPAQRKLNIFQQNARNKVTASLDLNASSAYATLLQFQANAKNKVAAQLGAGHNAAGTNDWRGGMTWVGEAGPELVYLPEHSQVKTARQSKDMANGNGGITVKVYPQPGQSEYEIGQHASAAIAWQAAIA